MYLICLKAFCLSVILLLMGCTLESGDGEGISLTPSNMIALEAAKDEDGTINLDKLEASDPELAVKFRAMSARKAESALPLPEGLPTPPSILSPDRVPDGTLWPDYNLLDDAVDLEKAKSGWTIINYWADWCSPCIAELPDIERAANILKQDGISILTIQADTSKGKGRDAAQAMFTKRGVENLSLMSALDKKAAKTLLTQSGNPQGALPFNVIYAPDGRPVGIFSGGATDGSDHWSSEEGLAWFRALPESGL